MRYRIRWCRHYDKWVLETEPSTSSVWDVVAYSSSKQILRWKAYVHTSKQEKRDELNDYHKVVDEFTI